MKVTTPLGLALCLHLSVAPAQAAGVYKWIDQHGTTHYSDRPSMEHPGARLDRLPYLNTNQAPPDIPRRKTAMVKKRKTAKRTANPDCDRFRTEISEIEATLRMGYTEPAGSRLRMRKRKWTDRLQKECY